MTVDNLEFYNEEIVLKKEELQVTSKDVFTSSGMNHERGNYVRCVVTKVGEKQTTVKVGEVVLVDSNGFPREVIVDGYGIMTNTYVVMNHLRLFCKLNE